MTMETNVTPEVKPRKLVSCPYKVLVNGELTDQFYDVRDAIAAARGVKREHPNCQV
jgi:hypothetical protein